MRRRAIITAAALGAALTPVDGVSAAPAEVAIGGTLRDARLRGLNGPDRMLSAYRGRPLVINVWASWCAPCRAEMASLERLAWHDLARGFAIIGISTDDYRERAMAVLKQTNATISHFIDHQLELEHLLGATQIPLTVLVDAQHRVRDRVVGARDWDSPDSLQRIGRAFGLRKAPGNR